LTDEHLRRALARKARDRAVQLFAAERCFALYRSLYEELGPSQGKYIALPTEHDEDIAIPIEQEVFHLASSGPFVGATPGEGLVEPEVLA
jgi:hypothetical protein